jgi:hypothetical protein
MGLFKPAWQSANKEKALAAVRNLDDQKQIAMAAQNAADLDVRLAAI